MSNQNRFGEASALSPVRENAQSYMNLKKYIDEILTPPDSHVKTKTQDDCPMFL